MCDVWILIGTYHCSCAAPYCLANCHKHIQLYSDHSRAVAAYNEAQKIYPKVHWTLFCRALPKKINEQIN